MNLRERIANLYVTMPAGMPRNKVGTDLADLIIQANKEWLKEVKLPENPYEEDLKRLPGEEAEYYAGKYNGFEKGKAADRKACLDALDKEDNEENTAAKGKCQASKETQEAQATHTGED